MVTIPYEPGNFYHIYNRGNNKENLFREERNYYFFLQRVSKYLLPVCNIYAYCLMPNHFHFVVEIKSYEELPIEYVNGEKSIYQAFSNLFNSYTKSINKAYERTGSLFQEQYGKKVIDDEDVLCDVILYVHLNPVKHGFCEDIDEYKYSSFKAMISKASTNVKRDEVFSMFGDIDNFKYCHQCEVYKNLDKLSEIEE